MAEREKLIELKDLQITFGSGKKKFVAVDHVNFDIYKGETFGLVGESGSGKTTIGRAILRILPTTGGEILYKGQRINGKIPRALDRQLTREIQMIFQDPQSSLNERAKVSYIVGEGLMNVRPDLTAAQREEKVRQALLDVGLLPEFASRFPHEFSGGQRQRIGIARALIVEPEFIIADEPISALDMSIRAQVLNLLRHLQKERGITYLFIAHDLSVMRYISDRIAVIYKGDIVEVATAEELFNFPLHPYTHSLISAIPIPDPQLEKNKVLYTYDPSIHDYSVDKPELVCIGHDHWVYGSPKEIEEYRAKRDAGVPIKSVNIVSPEEKAREMAAEEETPAAEPILERHAKDTGSLWYGILSFFLPILGLIAAAIFKKYNFISNFRVCKKGAIAGLITLAALIALFGVFLVISQL